jgi:hypothetical protein
MKVTLNYIDYSKWDNELDTSHGKIVEHLLKNNVVPIKKKFQIDSEVPKEWLEASMQYMLKEISPDDRITLYNYTTEQYEVINDFMNGGDLYVEKMKLQITMDPKLYVHQAFNSYKDEPNVKKMFKQWVQADSQKESNGVVEEFKMWLDDQPEDKINDKIQLMFKNIFIDKCSPYLPQLRVLDIHTIAQLRKKCLSITPPQWRRVLTQYVKDIKQIFKRAPPLTEPFTVYRGLQQHPKPTWKGLVSVSLSKEIANRFINPIKKCCIQTIELPKGARVLPMFTMSLIPKECELLLLTYPAKTRKNKA